MAQDLFHYERMVEAALRGVVRDALARVGREGLRGGHRFYITFGTAAPGVEIPEELRARFQPDMTIVLQHQFWDLEVDNEKFSVTLSFQKQLEKLVIPFAAIRSFADPSVEFALEFTPQPGAEATASPRPAALPAVAKPAAKSDDKNDEKKEDEKPAATVVALDAFRKR
ncbi:MAG TPA: ClpXP protease specificity-enhancing factor SspB [Stellaceae bacterium]|jgi:hypothetical protein|nr:ClpXP protease specificity-enhancing factor SspB [Stellaceae bacterium]